MGETQITLNRPPFQEANKWENLCLPADHANNKLDRWHQKNSDSYGTPWAPLTGAPATNSLIGTVSQIIVNSGTSIQLHHTTAWGTFASDNILGNGSELNWALDTANKKFSFDFFLDNDQEEDTPIVINDDGGAAFWTAGGGHTLTDDSGVKAKGTDSLKVVTAGPIQFTIWHTYGGGQDWSAKKFLGIYFYGNNSGHIFRIQLRSTAGNYKTYDITDNFSGWQRSVFSLLAGSETGTLDLSSVTYIQIQNVSATTAVTNYIDRSVVDVGQWVQVEVYVPDTLATGSGKVMLYSWDSSAYQNFGNWDAEDEASYLTSPSNLYYLDGTLASEIDSGGGNNTSQYGKAARGATPTKVAGNAAAMTFSSNYGCQQRIGFAIKMPPDDGQDSSSAGISQCKLKLEVYYDNDGDTTYEFEDSTNQYYGLQNIDEQYIVLFKDDVTGLVDFLELKAGLSINALTVKANHNNEISEVVIGISGSDNTKEIFWGQSDENPATETGSIPDVITNISTLVLGGGY